MLKVIVINMTTSILNINKYIYIYTSYKLEIYIYIQRTVKYKLYKNIYFLFRTTNTNIKIKHPMD